MQYYTKDNRKRKKVESSHLTSNAVDSSENPPGDNQSDYCAASNDDVIAQSPISLERCKAEKWVPLRLISFLGHWRLGSEVLALNNGLTALMSYLNRSDAPLVSGGPLRSKFLFAQLHFHWAEDDHAGTEHSIDGQKYAAEVHLVHYNRKYSGFDEALTHSDGLAVLGFLLKISPSPNAAFQPIVDAVKKIPYPLQEVTLKSGDFLNWMLDIDLNECYFTYRGSLTTDPYHESVTWIVYENTISISEDQMQSFRCMNLCHQGKKIVCNSRALQTPPVNLRIRHVDSRSLWLHRSIPKSKL